MPPMGRTNWDCSMIYCMIEGDLIFVVQLFSGQDRVRSPDKGSGDVLWVCPRHYEEYDPGLSVLSEQL